MTCYACDRRLVASDTGKLCNPCRAKLKRSGERSREIKPGKPIHRAYTPEKKLPE